MALTALTRDDPRRVGRYRIRARLGAGGMGVVYLGFQGRRPLAIKVLRRELAESRAFRVRFGREIAAASRVEATCTAAFVSGDADADPPYFAIEYVPGPTLEAYVAERGPLHGDALRALAVGIADGLAAIGRAGLVHRDLKPTNVLMTPTGPKVIDFGVAAGDDTLGLTQTGQRIGTPKWMAPEQVQGGAVTPATDVFAWGALVAFAGTALPPFGTGDSEAVLYRVVHATPTVAELDPVIGPLVERALAKEPDQRPSVEEIVKVLLEGDTTDPSTAASDVSALLDRAWPHEVPPDDASFPTAGQLRHYRRRRRPLVAIAALALVLIATAGTVYAIERSPSKPKPAAAPGLFALTTQAPSSTTFAPTTSSSAEPATTIPAATKVSVFQVFAHDGGPAPERCGASTADVSRSDAYRCFPGVNEVARSIGDPCFTDGFAGGTKLLCALSPIDSGVAEVDPTGGLDDLERPSRDEALPWFLVLANGKRCRIYTGATGTLAGQRLNYGCRHGGEVYGDPQRGQQPWRILYKAPGSATADEVAIARVYF